MSAQQIRERLWKGLFGAGLDRLAVGLGPLILVPIFISKWGVEGYGQWVTAQALASFVTLACAGFILASSTEIAIAYAQDKRIEINTLLSTISLAMLVLGGACSVLASIFAFWNAGHSNVTVAYLFVVLSLSTTASLIPALLFRALSSCGRYGEADFLAAILKTIEIVLVIAFLLFANATQIGTAYVLVAFNIASIAIAFGCMKLYLPWIYLKISFFDRRLLRQLAGPILSTFAYNIGYNQLLLQGPRLLVGYAFGMADVAVYNVINIVARMVRVPVDVAVTVFRVEISFAHSGRQSDALKDLFMVATQIAIVVTFGGIFFMFIFGDYLIGILSAKAITMNWLMFSIFLISIVFECVSLPSLTYLVAINEMTRPAVSLIASLFIGFLASLISASVLGPYGVAAAVAVSTFIFGAVSILATLQAIELAPGEYLRGMGKIPVKRMALELRRGCSLLGIGKSTR